MRGLRRLATGGARGRAGGDLGAQGGAHPPHPNRHRPRRARLGPARQREGGPSAPLRRETYTAAEPASRSRSPLGRGPRRCQRSPQPRSSAPAAARPRWLLQGPHRRRLGRLAVRAAAPRRGAAAGSRGGCRRRCCRCRRQLQPPDGFFDEVTGEDELLQEPVRVLLLRRPIARPRRRLLPPAGGAPQPAPAAQLLGHPLVAAPVRPRWLRVLLVGLRRGRTPRRQEAAAAAARRVRGGAVAGAARPQVLGGAGRRRRPLGAQLQHLAQLGHQRVHLLGARLPHSDRALQQQEALARAARHLGRRPALPCRSGTGAAARPPPRAHASTRGSGGCG